MKKAAVILLSGGIDSAATLYTALRRGYKCSCLIFDYGQRHKREIRSAKAIARRSGSLYYILKIRLPWKGSSLLEKNAKIPGKRSFKKIKDRIPSTYVPSRNTIFLSFAASFAEAVGAKKIFIGANAVDFSGYPDCRPGYITCFNKMIKRGTKARDIKVEAPLMNKTKSSIIKLASSLGAPLEVSWSCYEGGRSPCGVCDSCSIRAAGFKKAGIEDLS